MNFCSKCGAQVTLRIPPEDDRPRHVCDRCGTIHYENPKMVVGCIAEKNGQILLCRRAIQPGYGKWTLPAGYMENNETVYEGTRREAWEEAGATIQDLTPFALVNLSFISQVYLMFRARLVKTNFTSGGESLEIRLFEEAHIPWDQLAFPVIRETLRLYCADRPRGAFSFHVCDLHADGRVG
ncbi:NUDIX hydrolase [Desulfoferrobacter suflitae]|uniref:NUDIX hydrolase n=1 Tax=Desulfoferrobacter suflitae TaxID=2865782 RepID=UPI00216482E8|nr:NUDIX hydrolase [Desulfoferrobacter suflitae]MCK8600656.1 NUDIX hydrolase [Desulfoferrobacter suflitae]